MGNVLGIDLDGTLADTFSEWFYLYNRDNNTNYDKSMLKVFSINSVIPIDKPIIQSYFKRAWENWDHIKLADEDEVKVIKELSKKYKIKIITATCGESDYIKRWLDENEIYYDEIIKSHSSDKFNHCDILIDDKIKTTNIVAMKGKTGILIKRPWSREYEDEPINDSVKIVDNWKSIQDLLN